MRSPLGKTKATVEGGATGRRFVSLWDNAKLGGPHDGGLWLVVISRELLGRHSLRLDSEDLARGALANRTLGSAGCLVFCEEGLRTVSCWRPFHRRQTTPSNNAVKSCHQVSDEKAFRTTPASWFQLSAGSERAIPFHARVSRRARVPGNSACQGVALSFVESMGTTHTLVATGNRRDPILSSCSSRFLPV